MTGENIWQNREKVSMTYKEAFERGSKVLDTAGIAESKLDAWYLLEQATKIDRNFYYVHGNNEMLEEQQKEFEIAVKKRAEHIPLQYIIGEQQFMGIDFKVNSNVLIPRQDTEILVEQALKVIRPGMQVLDLCTGSGCIIISIMKNIDDITGYGVDISKQALLVAKENARLNSVVVNWQRSDMFENINETFDMIVSNPPYIPTKVIDTLMPEVRDFEPVEALDGKEDGLFFYRKIVEQSSEYLNPNGYLYMEIGHDQGEAVSQMMVDAGYKDVQVVKDLAGLDRVVKGQLSF